MNTRSIFECNDINVLKRRYKNVYKQYRQLNSEITILSSRIDESKILCLPKTSKYFHDLRLSTLRNNRNEFSNLAKSIKKRIHELLWDQFIDYVILEDEY